MGEVFYQGLNRLVAKCVRIKHLEHSLDKLNAQKASQLEELLDVHAKANEDAIAHRKALGLL